MRNTTESTAIEAAVKTKNKELERSGVEIIFDSNTQIAWIAAFKIVDGKMDSNLLFQHLNRVIPVVPIGYGESTINQKAPMRIGVTMIREDAYEIKILSLPFAINLANLAIYSEDIERMTNLVLTVKEEAEKVNWGLQR